MIFSSPSNPIFASPRPAARSRTHSPLILISPLPLPPPTQVYKFRAKSAAEGEQWTSQLQAWREHFLLN